MTKHYIKFISSMLIFGTVGIFAKYISLPSDQLVFARTFFGSIFLLAVLAVRKEPFEKAKVKANLPIILLAGIAMGFSWIFLFESYKHTSVSAATLAYYCAPIIVIFLSPLILKERITPYKVAGIISAMVGMLLINGAPTGGSNPKLGLFFGLMSAVLYAALMFLCKYIKGVSGLQSTAIQFISATVAVGVWIAFTNKSGFTVPDRTSILALLVVCILHTGIACYLYFTSIRDLSGQTIAMLSYLDPLTALFASAIFLDERLIPIQILGAVLLLFGATAGEILENKSLKRKEQTL